MLHLQSHYTNGKYTRALSSAGSEHLPYKQGVTGSNPVGPTNIKACNFLQAFFY